MVEPSLSGDPRTRYMMPITFGQAPLIQEPGFYAEATAINIIYEIDYDAAARLLPTWVGTDGKRYGFRPQRVRNGSPLLLFTYAQMQGVNALAWKDYNALAVNLTVEFIGEHPWQHGDQQYDGATGTFYLLVLENDAWACMIGREMLGVPKLHTVIPDPLLLGKTPRLGHFTIKDKDSRAFMSGKAALFRVPKAFQALVDSQAAPQAGREADPDAEWGTATAYEPIPGAMAWKHIPHPDSAGIDLSYGVLHYGGPLLLPDDPRTELAEFEPPLVGSGRVRINTLVPSRFPEGFQAINRLKRVVDRHCRPFPLNAMLLHYPHYVLTGHRLDGPALPAAKEPAR